jgi:glycosyltransferase involved in cell wall biosynthesis
MHPALKFSVITPSLNQARFIENAIRSVIDQDYPGLEYFVIDGGSTDGTPQLLERYQDRLSFVSEIDGGQANAVNKGLKWATGDIVCWLNADDEFLPGALHTAAAYFCQHPRTVLIYGDAEIIDEKGRFYGYRGNTRPTNFNELVARGDFIVQPAAFWRSELLAEVGYLDETLNYCLDYEYWLRVSQKYPLDYIPVPLARERVHSRAKTSLLNIERVKELELVARRYGNPNIPRLFQSEQTAVYLVETVRQIRSRNWPQTRHFWKLATGRFHPSLRLFPYLLAIMLGPKGATTMRLYHNLLRSKLRQKTLSRIPTELIVSI